MNNILCILTITFIVLNSVDCWVAISPNATHPDYPNKCYYKGPPDVVIAIGEKRRLPGGGCAKLECSSTFDVHIIGCGKLASGNHCHVVPGDMSKPFPDCCDEIVC